MIGRLAAAWTGRPLVYHVHSPTSRDSTRGWANRVNTWIEKLSVVGAARLIPVSHSLERHMQSEGYSTASLQVVPNGVPLVNSVPHRNTPTGEWTLGAVALFRPRKGTEVLIDALAMLREKNLPAKLLCVGGFETPEYERQLKVRVAQHQLEAHVEWTGFTTDVDTQLQRMDLFVLPSLFGEGLPMVVLEAMAAGVPVVATDVEGVPEAIRDGVDGIVARPQDAGDLAASIARVMCGELDWEQLRLSALVRQHDHFSDRSMAAGVAKVYDDILRADQS
jgi:glycosyltransferase involved in cell wall biosynthesis